MDLRHALSGDDQKAVIHEAERGEHFSLGIYKDALEGMLPPTVRDVVESQYAEVQKTGDRLRALETVAR
jgi:uncharacterized protein (TIGR02284 family)